MCLIIVGNKNNVVKEKTILENALTTNSDGFGLMYFKNDEVISKKTLSKSFSDVTNLNIPAPEGGGENDLSSVVDIYYHNIFDSDAPLKTRSN